MRAAEWLAARMRDIGLTTEVVPTEGHPIVVGEWRKAGEGAPTVLIYGHYDVQPAEPLELWESPPFEPTVRDGRIYARGSVDDKGQLYLHVKALEAHLRTRGTLPVNVIVLAEGEEEVGSPNLASFIETQAKRLACDAVVISDSSMFAPGLPSILSSLRGLAYVQIDVQGPAVDLHSGSYGGAVINPATALARIIATLSRRAASRRDPGLLRQGARMVGRRSRARFASCRSTNEVPRRSRRARARRRGWAIDAGAHLDSADLRGQRSAERLHGRRREDGAACRRRWRR